MIELMDGNFKYKEYIFSINKFEGEYFGKVNIDGTFTNFHAKTDNEAINKAKEVIDKHIKGSKK